MGDRDAAEVGADADDDQPLVVTLLDPGLVGLRIRKARDRHAAGLLDLLLGAVHDVNRLPRQNTFMSCPEAIGVRSTSIGAPAAIVDASGFIWETNGQSVATPPTAAAHPVATKRKSRRVGCSAADAVVTITTLSKLQPVAPAQSTHKPANR